MEMMMMSEMIFYDDLTQSIAAHEKKVSWDREEQNHHQMIRWWCCVWSVELFWFTSRGFSFCPAAWKCIPFQTFFTKTGPRLILSSWSSWWDKKYSTFWDPMQRWFAILIKAYDDHSVETMIRVDPLSLFLPWSTGILASWWSDCSFFPSWSPFHSMRWSHHNHKKLSLHIFHDKSIDSAVVPGTADLDHHQAGGRRYNMQILNNKKRKRGRQVDGSSQISCIREQ